MRAVKVFWASAVALSLWELLAEPLFTEIVRIMCVSGGPLEFPQPNSAARAAGVLGAVVTPLQPLLLALIGIWAIRSLHRAAAVPPAGRARGVSLLPATLGMVAALLPTALSVAVDLLMAEPSLMWRECLEDQLPAPSFAVPRQILAWLLSPAAMVLLAGLAGAGRWPRPADLRDTGLAVAAVVLAAFLPGVLLGPPANADGTPRYALVGGYRPYVLDLESGKPVRLLPKASRVYAQYEFVVRDTEPGRYVAALTSPTQRYFRLYRLSMGLDGRVTMGERLTPTIKGTISGLAVSPEGRVAYGRLLDGRRFTGTLDREWPVSGYGLQWLDDETLALPEHGVAANALATLDVGTGTIGQVAAPPEHEFTRPVLPLPGGRMLRALGWPTRTLVVHEGTRLVKKVLALDCGHIERLALAPDGRHALVGVDRQADEMERTPLAGLPACGGARTRLLRVDLETGDSQVVPGPQDTWVQAW
ncbi:hypothetical protein HII36_36560 [Nonomuraea sp. NN258]|uniref:hypothetical protein n=1 Tax=Nonomuraea antri TaxID=2730852 RepID=UPI0015684285|nr:hypothetical protein [Nonomuraea antri]NRQ37309.1 hypothetical protein [Nonomuraea antri]